MFSSVLPSDTNTISKRSDTFTAGTDKTILTWTVGRFRKFGAGKCISKVIKTGQSQQWRLSFYPKGFTSSDYVSFFITNVGLEGGNNEKVKASVAVVIKPQEQNNGKTRSKGRILEDATVTKRLDKTFSPGSHTFGFNKLAESDMIFRFKNGLVWDVPDNDPSRTIDGKLSLQIELRQFESLDVDAPELHSEITPQGWQRVEWVLKDIKGLTEKLGPGQLISSEEFRANGEWYIDLYPCGYRVEQGDWVSVFLHSSLRQAERGLQLKRRFRFGIRRQNRLPAALSRRFPEADDDDEEVFFPRGSADTSLFGRHSRTAGKQAFVSHALLTKGRNPPGVSDKELSKQERAALAQEFVAGRWASQGSVTLVLDILVLDSAEGQVQQMLHVTPAFQNDLFQTCAVTGRKFNVPAVFGGAKGKPSPCYLCGRRVAAELLTAGPETRLPEFGYEVGREEVMDVVLREAGQGAWMRGPVRELQGWVREAVAGSKALRELREGVQALRARVRSARSGLLCEGLERSDSEEEDGGGPQRDRATQRERERARQERALQLEAARRLRALRQRVEDAQFSKPVCPACTEHCRTRAAMPAAAATRAQAGREDPPSFAAGWRRKLAMADAAYEAARAATRSTSEVASVSLTRGHASSGGASDVSTLARGGFTCEPMEDEELDTFCDVRFDRKGTLLSAAPKKFHCHGTGKVFCAHCVRFKASLPEHEKDPSQPTPQPVSHQVHQDRQYAAVKIQPVSERRAPADAAVRKKVVLNGDDGDDDRDSDDEDPRWAFLRGLLDQGKGLLLEGNLKAAGAS